MSGDDDWDAEIGAGIACALFFGLLYWKVAAGIAIVLASGALLYFITRYVVVPTVGVLYRTCISMMPKPKPPPIPSRSELLDQSLKQAQEDFDLECRTIDAAGLDGIETQIVKLSAKQRYLRRLRSLLE